MKKSKILLILDDSIINSHHGVRRYVLSLTNAIKDYLDVDYIIHRKISGIDTYFRVVFSRDFVINNGFYENNLVGESRHEIIRKIRTHSYINISNNLKVTYACSYLGEKIPDEYSLVIVAAPWIHINKHSFSCVTACIGLDAIPNIYALHNIDNQGLREFAWQHKIGFEYYDLILSISDESKKQISYFVTNENKILSIPPFIPAGFEQTIINKTRSNEEKTVVLAAPFDERKGVIFIPKLINNSDIERIIIFGSVRCSFDMLLSFFEDIAIEKIEWWSSVTTHKQIELYQRARALLFPSLNEGLGLPVLESLACNTPAIVSNIKPLNELVESSFIIDLNDELSKNTTIINNVINIPDNYDLKNESLGHKNITNFIAQLIKK
ncbi:glycosyltransferase family 4 protein [Yersinia hibernica]|uniref:Glycosyltransferase n=1 Tax=Yersinia hibernica TaxID=2339259 RepID=A0ABX5R0Q7_9GAMM|nr:glycosyltransferase family 4 protein [Yersinia hibernica]QAX79181.1 glycosyltransferase [Yersinia hibernica]